jgi:hypothetical protein
MGPRDTGAGRDALAPRDAVTDRDARGARDAAADGDARADGSGRRDGGSASDAQGREGGAPCHATPADANAARKIVVSHPFGAAGNPASDFEVFDLSATGAITQPGVHFRLGPTSLGEIAFTPDGAVGLVAEDDGSLGVFRFDGAGAPHVVAASLAGSYYATAVVMDPSGARAYIVDDQTAGNGGGIYAVSIACDGTVTDDGLLAGAELPAAVVPLASGRAVVAAKSFLGVPRLADGGASDASLDAPVPVDGGVTANDAVLVPWPGASAVLAYANPFGDDLAIVSSAAATNDGRYVLIGDNSQFSGIPNRVGVVDVSAGGLSAGALVENVNDPETLVASPFDDTVLVTSAFGNAIFVLGLTTDGGAGAFDLVGPVAYVGAAPQLPGPAVMITRGSLEGRVFVAENLAIRQLQFATAGRVTDLGPTAAGDPSANTTITGAIGVQP